MTDRDALLRAICENPGDDAPRLVYADWLDEHGDPLQAEFIRLQIETSPISWFAKDEGPRVKRQRELWKEVPRWRFARTDWSYQDVSAYIRGFCPNWQGTAADFLRVAPHYWRLGPTHSIVMFFEKKSEVRVSEAGEIATREWLGRLRQIDLCGRWLSDDWVIEFVSSPYAGHWRSIRLDSPCLTDATCEALASSSLARNRCQVVVSSKRITDDGHSTILAHFPGPEAGGE